MNLGTDRTALLRRRTADLHAHTRASDGGADPGRLFDHVEAGGVGTRALPLNSQPS